MKKIYALLLITSFLIGTSCSELEEEPVGLLSPSTFFQSPSDVEAAVVGGYGLLAREQTYGRKLSLTLQLLSDMCDIGDRNTPARRQEINDFRIDSGNGMVSAIWPALFTVVGATNAAIQGTEQVDMTEEMRNRYEAEARFIRAFTYYHLVRLFGDVPYLDMAVTDPKAISDIESTPVSEIYTHIIEDLEFGMQYLPDQYNGNIRSRATKGTAATVLASVHLTLGNWAESAEMAQYVINNASTFGYALVEDFQNLFRAELGDQTEHIFTIDFLGNNAGAYSANDDIMGAITGIRGADQNGWSVSVPSMQVYNTWDPRDYRKDVSFEDTALVQNIPTPYTAYQDVQRPHIAKFARFPGNSNAEGRYSDHNYPAFRYAEVLLIAAEALNEANGGPTAEAYQYINMVRARARNWAGIQTDFPANLPMGMSQDAFRQAVLEERRLELAFEFKRWYDIKRRNLLEEVFTGPNSLEPHQVAPNNYLLPLPQDELDRNPNLRAGGGNNGY